MTTLATKNSKKIAVLITAAGSSTRMGGSIKKEYLSCKKGTVLSNCAKTFLKAFLQNTEYCISNLVITCPVAGKENCQNALNKDAEFLDLLLQLKENCGVELCIAEGSTTRQASVFNGLKEIQKSSIIPDIVLIHDGARPFVSEKIILDTAEATFDFGAAVPGVIPCDTQKEVDENGFITRHLVRKNVNAVQTPQGFDFKKLYEAHKELSEINSECTDDTEVWGKIYGEKSVKVVAGDVENKKITYPGDLETINTEFKMKIGLGYDLHRLVEGRKLLLGGIEIPFEKGEDGHSDGDVLFHAITDAVLGAAGLGDIGSFFPPEEAKWKDADSAILLKTVMEKVREAGFKIGNLDCVVKLEKPKFLPYRNQVIDSIARTLGCSSTQVFVKAKTGEKLPPVGTSQAVEAEAVCILVPLE